MESIKNGDPKEKSKFRIGVVLTRKEEIKYYNLLSELQCANLTQVVKKILRNELAVMDMEEYLALKYGKEVGDYELKKLAKKIKTDAVLAAFNYSSVEELINDLISSD